MRSTVRIDDDLMSELKHRAKAEDTSLTRMLNRVLRAGLAARPARAKVRRFKQATARMGVPKADLTKSLQLAATLEDEEVARKLAMRK